MEEQSKQKRDLYEDVMSFDFIFSGLPQYEIETIKICKDIIKLFQQEPIDTKKLFYSKNFFDILQLVPTLRPLCWRLLLNYLPEQRKRWVGILESNKINYQKLVEQYTSKLCLNNKNSNINKNQKSSKQLDHPLSKKTDSSWNSYFSDKKLWDKIIKDTKRTRTKEDFFQQNIKYAPLTEQFLQTQEYQNDTSVKTQKEIDKTSSNNLEEQEQIGNNGDENNGSDNRKRSRTFNFLKKLRKPKQQSTQKNSEKDIISEENNNKVEIDHIKPENENNNNIKNSNSDNNLKIVNTNTGTKNIQKEKILKEEQEDSKQHHYQVITRILFIYGKLNPQFEYTQGMNEICAVIYHCFFHDTSDFFRSFVESDTFYCFCILMTSIKSNFEQDDDPQCEQYNSLTSQDKFQQQRFMNSAIRINIQNFEQLFHKCDHILFNHLKKHEVDSKLYVVKWLIVLLAQDFEIHKVYKIWDVMLISPDKMMYLNFVFLGILFIMRDDLLKESFSGILMKLQDISKLNVVQIIEVSLKLYKQYYSQNDILSYFSIHDQSEKSSVLDDHLEKNKNIQFNPHNIGNYKNNFIQEKEGVSQKQKEKKKKTNSQRQEEEQDQHGTLQLKLDKIDQQKGKQTQPQYQQQESKQLKYNKNNPLLSF